MHPQNPETIDRHVEPIFLGVQHLVDRHEWEYAVQKFPRLHLLVRLAIEACLRSQRKAEIVHALNARTQMNTEYSVKIIGRRLEEFFRSTFEIPALHSKRADDDDFRVQRAEPEFNAHDHDEDEHEPLLEQDHDDEFDFEFEKEPVEAA